MAAKKAADPAVARCLDAFYAGFVRRYNPARMAEAWLTGHGTPVWRSTPRPYPLEQMNLPIIQGGKDGSLLKKLLASQGEEKVRWLVDEFFAASRTDPRVVRAEPTIGSFFALVPHLLTRRMRLQDSRTAENIDAATRAMQPHGGECV